MRIKLFTACLAFSAYTQAMDLTIESTVGHDSNPFRLSDDFSPDSSAFWRNRVTLRSDRDSTWLYEIDGLNYSYSNENDADSSQVDVEFGRRFWLDDETQDLVLKLGYRQSDRTFVSRFQGDVYEVQGESVGDRYDYDRVYAEVKYDKKLKGRNAYQLRLRLRDQSYDDFSDLNLSRLDYQSAELRLRWQGYLSSKLRYRLYGELSMRDFDDRRAQSVNGERLAGTDLEYDAFEFGIDSRFRVAKGVYLYTRLGWSQREDNGGGFFDTDTLTGSARLRWSLSEGRLVSLSAYYRDLEYDRDNITTDLENDAEAPSTRGWRFVASYEKQLMDSEYGRLDWISHLRNYSDQSDLRQYEFDRLMVETGLRYRF